MIVEWIVHGRTAVLYRTGTSDHREWSTYCKGCMNIFFRFFLAVPQTGDSFERSTTIYGARVTVYYSTRGMREI